MPFDISGPHPDSEADDRFRVTADVAPEESLLRLTGELDHDTAPALREALARCEEARSARILVDCSGLVFCDSTGLNVLLEARRDASPRGAGVALVGMPGTVARIFEITGADTLFDRYASLDEARSTRS